MNFVRAFVPENLCTCIPVPKTSIPTYQGLHSKIPLASIAAECQTATQGRAASRGPVCISSLRNEFACIIYRVRLLCFA